MGQWVLAVFLLVAVAATSARAAEMTIAGDGWGRQGVTRQAGVFYEDDRVPALKYKGSPYGPIGILYRPSNGRSGSAFLVGPCYVLTNWHVVFQLGRPASTRFVMEFYVGTGVSGPEAIWPRLGARKSRAMPVVWGDFLRRGKTPRYVEDWVLLRLDECLGSDYGWMQLSALSADAAHRLGERLKFAAIPSDRDARIVTVDPKCSVSQRVGRALGPFEGMWAHDCAARRGSSGGPIFFEDAGGTFRVVALHSGSAHGPDAIALAPDRKVHPWFGGENFNLSVPVRQFIDRIAPYISRGVRPLSGRTPILAP